MPQARNRLVSLADTPYYHCISRCVRRAFLCGVDPLSGFDFSHRRDWVVARMQALSRVFALDVCAYAVMSNHYHIVVRVEADVARSWPDREVVARWLQLFSGPPLAQRYLDGDPLSAAEQDALASWIDTWRQRLHDLSWFMRCLNESIARRANREDCCSGRFCEGRFRSQALLDQRALLACMAYVDLNPIRAGLAQTPEASDYTSIQQRIQAPHAPGLRRFSGNADDTYGIPCDFEDYLQLVDWAGRAVVAGKKGFIPSDTPAIVLRMGMQPGAVLAYIRRKPERWYSALGPVDRVRLLAHSIGLKFIKGISLGRRLCPTPG
jgi:REP element-mobilizing transposase RayT